MKSHRKHAPELLDSNDSKLRKGFPKGKISPDGVKRMKDKLDAAIKSFWFWYEIRESGKAHEAKCPYKAQGHRTQWGVCYHGTDGGFLKDAQRRVDKLWQECSSKGIV